MPRRSHPYRQFRFRVHWHGRVVAGFARVTALPAAPGVAEYRAGKESSPVVRLAGACKSASLTLERGMTDDPGFREWITGSATESEGPGHGDHGLAPREELVIERVDERGRSATAFRVFGCRFTKLTALRGADEDPDAATIASMTLEHDGWIGEVSLPEPDESGRDQRR